MPDFSQVTENVKRYMPEMMYPSADEAARVNRQRIEQNLAYYRANPQAVDARLAELKEEWDVDRVLQVTANGLTLTGFWFSMTRSRLWLLVAATSAGCALHHGITGNSPAKDVIRRFGFRTRDEIDSELQGLHRIQQEDQPGSSQQSAQQIVEAE